MEGAQTTPVRGNLKCKLDLGFQGQDNHRKVLIVGDHMCKDVRSSTKPSSNHWDYEVFLSFRGADTRKNFTDHPYFALVRTGIRTFYDDNELPRGENISKELINAIHGSRTSLIIFSKDYASSSWCLDELVQILHCKTTMNQIFIPIFYHVNPSDMRKQIGTFAKTFDRLEERFQEDMERVQRWRAAFTEAADCSGFDLQSDANGYEARFIEKIVEQVLYKLNPIRLDVVEHPVRSPHAQIQKILGISFESLDHTTREVFLDIACFFTGVNIESVFKILEECGFFPDIAINILVQRSLVKIDYPNLSMHDLIRDMGREIVRQESRHPGIRSRLWYHEDVLKVLKNHLGSEVVEGLSLNPPIHDQDQVISLKSEAFANMKNLRLLQIKGVKNLKLEGYAENLSKELRWICWHSCPLKFLPPRLHLENLVVLDMQYSKIKQLWKLENNILSKLKVLNLSFCEDLTKSPNFVQVPNLEELILEGCIGLVELHESIGYLKGLGLLNLNGCKSLMSLPKSISNLKSLRIFHIGRCFNMRNFTDRTIINLPNRSWNPINFLRASLNVFRSLVKLGLSNSNLLEGDFPIDFGALSLLQDLDLSVNNFRELPHGICRLPKLARLNLAESRSIRSISTLPTNLRILFAFGCESLERISILESRLDALVLADCYKLVDIQGFENLAFTIVVSLEGCLKQEEDNDFLKSLLELQKWKWPSMIERRHVYLYGDEIPNWFSHKRKGSSISFHIPSLSDQDGVINGLVFGVVCKNKNSLHAWHGEISVVLHNKTKGHRQVIDRIFYSKVIGSVDRLLLLQVGVGGGSKIPYGQEMTNGQEIEVSFEFECSQALEYVGVNECGVHPLIIQREEAGSMVYSEKKKKMMEDNMMQDTPVTKLTRHRPHNRQIVREYDGIVTLAFVSYMERNTSSTLALPHSLG